MRILVAGPQGSGKTTQAKILAEKLGVCFISTGDLMRELSAEDTEEGKLVKSSLEKGALVDDQIAADALRREIESDRCRQGFVSDGFPRHLGQLEYFDPQFDKVIYLDVPDEEVIKRLLARGRADDTLPLILERLSIYHGQTEPVLNLYESQGKLVRIDGSQAAGMTGEQSIEQIAAAIAEKMGLGEDRG